MAEQIRTRRVELYALLGLSRQAVRSLERAGALAPTYPGKFRTDSEAEFDNVDVGAAFAVAAVSTRWGLRGSALAKVWNAAQSKRKRLTGGFDGWLLVDGDGDGELAPTAEALGQLLGQVGSVAVCVPLRVAPPNVHPRHYYGPGSEAPMST